MSEVPLYPGTEIRRSLLSSKTPQIQILKLQTGAPAAQRAPHLHGGFPSVGETLTLKSLLCVNPSTLNLEPLTLNPEVLAAGEILNPRP